MLNDNTIITIGPNTSYSFETYNDSTDSQLQMRIKRGFFKAVSGKIGKLAPKRFKIKTNSATIGIRGTHFMGHIEEGYEKIVCLKGEIIISIDVLEPIIVKANEMIVLSDGTWTVLPMDLSEFTSIVLSSKFKPTTNIELKAAYLKNTYKYGEIVIQARSQELVAAEPFTIDFSNEPEVTLPPLTP